MQLISQSVYRTSGTYATGLRQNQADGLILINSKRRLSSMANPADPELLNTRHPIEDVDVPFNNRTKKPKPILSKTHPELCVEWYYKKNCGFGPEDFSRGSSVCAWWQCRVDKKHIWRETISRRSGRGDGCPYCSHRRPTLATSLAKTDPELAKQWHPDNELTPKDVLASSHMKVLWQCTKRKSHTWFATPHNRKLGKTDCPQCWGERLANLYRYPVSLALFDHAKNKNIDPRKLGTNKKVWWRCMLGPDHTWQATFFAKKMRCPFCAGRKLSVTNSLQAVRPDLAKEFHPTRNGKLKATSITSKTTKRIWWRCSANKRHIWESTVRNRTELGNGCPGCWAERRPAAFVELRAKQREERLKRGWRPSREKKPLVKADRKRK